MYIWRAYIWFCILPVPETVNYLKLSRTFSDSRSNAYYKFMSGPVNPLFYSIFVKSDKFNASEKCVGCEKCEALCPLNNITLVNDKPVWGRECTHCMACICYCPTSAIEYGKSSIGRSRYNIESILK